MNAVHTMLRSQSTTGKSELPALLELNEEKAKITRLGVPRQTKNL